MLSGFLPGSFRSRLALLFGGIALAIGVPTALYTTHLYSAQLVADRGNALRDVAHAVAGVLADDLRQRQREMAFLAETTAFQRSPIDAKTLRANMEGLQKSHPYYTWIGFADAGATVRVATADLLVGVNVGQRPWFIRGSHHPYVGDLHEALLLAKYVSAQPGDAPGPVRFIDFATPVTDAQGRFIGVVAAHAHWRWARKVVDTLIDEKSRQAGQEVLIVNDRNQVIFPEKFDAQQQVPPEVGQGAGFLVASWGTGRSYLNAYASVVEPFPEFPLGWRVVVRQDRKTALAQVDALRRQGVLYALIAVALFLAIAWWSATWISRPLRRLTVAARRVEQGEEAEPLRIRTTTTELQQLIDSVRGMASTLIRRKTELEVANTLLDQRVRERTAELEALNAQLAGLAREDALTTLANRRAADEHLLDEFRRMKRTRTPYCVLLVDIDFFKRVNDTHGHAVGDAVLRHVAAVLAANVRESDFLARFGGEEFVVLLSETQRAEALGVAEKLRQSVEHSAPPGGVNAVSVSIGVAQAGADDASVQTSLQLADRNLYAAKAAGRNRVEG